MSRSPHHRELTGGNVLQPFCSGTCRKAEGICATNLLASTCLGLQSRSTTTTTTRQPALALDTNQSSDNASKRALTLRSRVVFTPSRRCPCPTAETAEISSPRHPCSGEFLLFLADDNSLGFIAVSSASRGGISPCSSQILVPNKTVCRWNSPRVQDNNLNPPSRPGQLSLSDRQP